MGRFLHRKWNLEMKISIVLNKKEKQSFPQKGFCVMFMSGIVQTSNFSSASRERGYNIDGLALPRSGTKDKTTEAAGNVLKQAARENRFGI
jgi:hypothetical protein